MFHKFAILFPLILAKRIDKLPGLNFKLYSDHYSGFLNVSKTERLFYWLVESQNTPSADPLIFWFNGGPGCSSLTGLLREHGPMLINKDGETFRENKYSWSRSASVVYIESPTGVGYSYSTEDSVESTNDDETATKNYEAIKQFFKEFPKLRHHDVFLAGESYGGVYVPTLAEKIIDGQSEYSINLKGMAIGNGFIGYSLKVYTQRMTDYSKGLISRASFQEDLDLYCDGSIRKCSKKQRIQFIVQDKIPGYDLYDIKRQCSINENCSPYPRNDLEKYFNNPNVRRSLNIPHGMPWQDCWTGEAILKRYSIFFTNVTDQIIKSVKNKVRTLLYYGDVDLICSFLIGQKFAANLGIKKIAAKSPWFFNNTLGGYKTLYDGLTFLTVRGAGHSVPETHPAQMFDIIQKFIDDKNI